MPRYQDTWVVKHAREGYLTPWGYKHSLLLACAFTQETAVMHDRGGRGKAMPLAKALAYEGSVVPPNFTVAPVIAEALGAELPRSKGDA